MGSEGFALWGMLFLGLLAGCVVLIIGMFVSMIRMDIGDERRQLIVGKKLHCFFHRHRGIFAAGNGCHNRPRAANGG